MESSTFNLLEGIWWVSLGIVVLTLRFFVTSRYQTLALVTTCLLVLFGLSDFLQVVYESFLVPGMEWLWYLKLSNVISLCGMIGRYLWLRRIS